MKKILEAALNKLNQFHLAGPYPVSVHHMRDMLRAMIEASDDLPNVGVARLIALCKHPDRIYDNLHKTWRCNICKLPLPANLNPFDFGQDRGPLSNTAQTHTAVRRWLHFSESGDWFAANPNIERQTPLPLAVEFLVNDIPPAQALKEHAALRFAIQELEAMERNGLAPNYIPRLLLHIKGSLE